MQTLVLIMAVVASLMTIAAIISKVKLAKERAAQQEAAMRRYLEPMNSLNRKHWR